MDGRQLIAVAPYARRSERLELPQAEAHTNPVRRRPQKNTSLSVIPDLLVIASDEAGVRLGSSSIGAWVEERRGEEYVVAHATISQ